MRGRALRMVAAVSCLFVASQVYADVAMPAMFASDMVLQRDMKVPVWGTAAPGEEVTVTVAGQTKKTSADDHGNWMVHLDPLKAGGPFTMTVAGKNTLAFENVLAGDVWLCGGQSNMAMRVQASMNWREEGKAADFPKIRHFSVRNVTAAKPTKDITGRWQVCSQGTVAGFTAVGYFFGRKLHRDLDVPIGLISSNWGGTPAQAWTPWQALADDEQFRKEITEPAEKNLAGYDEKKKTYDEAVAKWNEDVKKARAEKKPLPQRPRAPYGPDSAGFPSVLYNGMIYPLAPYAIKGAIWYQGESDASRAAQYRRLLPTMIASWRSTFEQPDFPFYIVQLANYHAVQPQPNDTGWTRLSEAQTLIAKTVPNCGLACIIDTGEANDIHPKNKQDVGRRLALVALAKTYGKDVVYSGPVFESMIIDGDKVRIRFTHTGGGLTTRTSEMPSASNMAKEGYTFTLGDGPVKGFALAGDDKKFAWADATIDGDTVVVSSKDVPKPVAVRYAWADNPVCNLYNKEGLPTVPFRTDDW